MTRPIIVLGHRADGSLEAIYVGGDGAEAEAAFEAAGAPDFVRAEEFRFPTASRRRDFEVPDLGTEKPKSPKVEKPVVAKEPAKVEEPKAEKAPKAPTKAEIKKAEKAARDAAKAAEKPTEDAEF